ncbi:MAG TPA: polysaccharide biosynthesis tyrosine autokinase [Aggregatilinea sp.]|jgi:non-specific protein-tyrosine kinase|uniref:polysaccharide biosynthesis tyrosine autokinase n=1 Tax=Aggregatilinea sp. TaxID=2806333 RepID=UPI002C9EC45D|nr:polysaccharide biosynthesis tyrosine autokinase [Aggregatilinea sp.]HML20740.1 polysaccharide biosynthesis tyrosine autokinase [Aggregatilinea sp.]
MSSVEWHVLAVDDNRVMRDEIEDWLKSNEIRVTTAPDGAAALKLLEEGLDPDVILSDIKMPKKDGFEFFDAVRANESWNWIRFVFLVEQDDQAFLKHADDMGIDSYLLKPFGKKELLHTVLDGVKNPRGERISARAGHVIEKVEIGEDGKLNHIPAPSSSARRPSRYANDATSNTVASEIIGYVHVLGRYKWVILIAIVAAVGISLLVTNQMTPTYSSTATIRVVSSPAGVEQDIWTVSTMATRLINTYAAIVTSGPVLDELAGQLNLDEAPDINVEIVPDSELMRITASSADPEVAAAAVNHLADILKERSLELYSGDSSVSAREILSDQVDQAEADYNTAVAAYEAGIADELPEERLAILERQMLLRQDQYNSVLQTYENLRIDEQLRSNGISVVEPGYVPDTADSPNKVLNLLLGLAGGLAAGLLLAFILDNFDSTLRGSSEAETLSGLPVLTKLPSSEGRWPRRRELSPLQANTYSIAADAYRQLGVRVRIQNVLAERGSILVTSPEKGSGKTTVTANLGVSLARAGYATIIVDGDFRSAGVHSIFNLPNKLGLSEVLQGSQPVEAALQNTSFKNLRVLTAGNSAMDLSDVATPERISSVMADLLKDCEYLIVDSPSVLAVADTAVLAALADAVILVASQRHTSREGLRLALQYLDDIQANVIGMVVNRVPMSLLGKYYARERRAVVAENSRAVSKLSS